MLYLSETAPLGLTGRCVIFFKNYAVLQKLYAVLSCFLRSFSILQQILQKKGYHDHEISKQDCCSCVLLRSCAAGGRYG